MNFPIFQRVVDRIGHAFPGRRCRSGKRLARGFTLVEVSIATAVAAVSVMGLMVVLAAAVELARKTSDETLHGAIVQELFAEIQAKDFKNVSLNMVTVPSPAPADYIAQPVDLRTANGTIGEIFFDPNGVRVPGGPQYFKCLIQFTPMEPSGYVSRVMFQFVEPAHTLQPVATNTFYGRIARREIP